MDPNTNSGSTLAPTPPLPETLPPTPAPSTSTVITPTIAAVPSTAPVGAAQPVVMVGGDFAPDPGPPIAVVDPAKPTVSHGPSRWKSKKVFIPLLAMLLLFGSASAYYFGYYMNPEQIYSQSLRNTGKGYDTLVDYIDAQSLVKQQSFTGDGSYKYASDSFSTDGKMSYRGNGNNNQVTFDFGVAGSRIKAEIRAIKSSGAAPDLYVKAAGIKGLGALTGVPEVDAAVNKIDDTWIFVDHTLFDSLTDATGGNKPIEPSREEIMDEVRAFGRVSQEYVFTTDKDKAVTMIVKKHGVEKVGGHKAYHYTIGLHKQNVKKYIDAQKAALKASKLDAWLKKNKYDTEVYASFDDMKKSADGIKSSDTFDIWMDVQKRITYKVRLADTKNPAQNYADIGLDYKGGDSYPFFITGQSKEGGELSTGSLVATLDTKTQAIDFKAKVKASGAYGGSFTANFLYKPTAEKITIDKPEGARPLADILSELGLGDILSQDKAGSQVTSGSLRSGIQEKAKYSAQKPASTSLQTRVEAYFNRLH